MDCKFVGGCRLAMGVSWLSLAAAMTVAWMASAAMAQTIGSGSTVKISSVSSSATPAFQGGTLQVDQAGTYANNFTLQGTVTTSTIDASGKAGGFSGIFSDAVSGTAGSLTFTDSVGGGVITFSGTNTYTGSTTINAGATLALTGTGSIATSGGLNNNGTFDISGTSNGASVISLSGTGSVILGARNLTLSSASGTFSGTISGAGELILTSGTEILSGSNSYSGGTVINGGTLEIGDGTGNGWIVGNVSDAGTLAFNRADAVTFAGLVSGSGGVSQLGSGTLTLTAANTFTGATNVSAGVLTLANSNAIANSSHVTVTGTLDVSAAGASIKSLAGTGTVQLGSQTLTFTAGSDTFSGVIAGSGNIVLLSGTQTLTGANTYSGTTLISGGTLRLGQSNIANAIADNGTLSFYSSGPIAMTGVVTGTGSVTQTGTGTTAITAVQAYSGETVISSGTLALSAGGSIQSSSGVTDNATFDISAATGGVSIVTLAGNGTLQLGTQTLTLTNASGQFGGNIAGSGELILAAGKETLSGTNAFTGLTTIASGSTLYLTSINALAASSAIVDNGTLDISGVTSTGLTLSTSITSLTGSGRVTLGSRTVILTNAADSFSGTISGAGSLTISGGTETLTGANTYTGTTNITAGVLALSGAGSLAATGTVQDSGIFDISAASAGGPVTIGSLAGSGTVKLGANSLNLTFASTSFTGTITGTGGLIVSGGTQILAGSNNYTGGTVISAGTLQIGNGQAAGSILGDVADNGTLAFDRTDTSTFAGAISGTGAVVQMGSGTTILTATNSYTGGTQISAGTLQIGNGGASGAIGGSVVDNGTLAFNRSDATAFAGVISGSGGVTQAGIGALTLTGVNTYSGATTINTGSTLILGPSASIVASNVVDNGTFDISASGAPQITSLSGSGLVTLGAQGLQLTKASGTFSGAITGNGGLTISGGTETLTGVNSYTGTTHVSGGTLAGTGTVSAVAVDNGGTLAPGVAGKGTLTINGALTMANGSNYLVNLSSASSSKTSITGAAALDGTLSIVSADGTYLLGQKMTILTAAGGVSGDFTLAPIQSSGAQFSSTLSYDANNVYLQIDLAKLSPLLPATATANQTSVVSGIDAAIAAGSSLPLAFNNLGNVSSETLAADAGQLSGEIAADIPRAGSALFDPFVNAIFDHLVDIRRAAPRRDVWASGFTGSDLVSGDAENIGSHKFKAHAAGFAGGADWTVAPSFTLGAAISAGATNFHIAGDLGQGRVQGYQAGIYGLVQVNPVFYGAFTGALGLDEVTTNRILAVSGSDQLTAKVSAVTAGGRFETGLKLGFLAPYLAFHDTLLAAPSYSETAASGASTFALKYAAQTTNTAGVEIGARQSVDIPLNRFWTVRLSDQAGWAHDMSGTLSADAQFISLAASGFTVDGVKPAKDAAQFSLGALFQNRNGLGVSLHLNSLASANSQSYTGIAGLNYAW